MFIIDWVRHVPAFVMSLNFLAILLVLGAILLLVGPPLAGKLILVRRRRYYDAAIRETRERRYCLKHAQEREAERTAIDERLSNFFSDTEQPAAALATRRLDAVTLFDPPPKRGWMKPLEQRRPTLLELVVEYDPPAMLATQGHTEPVQLPVLGGIPADVAARALREPTEEVSIIDGEVIELTEADKAFLADPLGSWVLPPVERTQYLPLADQTFHALLDARWGRWAAEDIDAEWRDWNLYTKEYELV